LSDLNTLETIASELITEFDINYAPVPIETILQNPKEGMWEKVDIAQLSGSFLSLKEPYSPRISIARLLARHLATCPWGRERGLFEILRQDGNINRFARMLIMPKPLVEQVTTAARNPRTMSLQFEVPEDDVRLRLDEVFGSPI
jgi:hypothetical protein